MLGWGVAAARVGVLAAGCALVATGAPIARAGASDPPPRLSADGTPADVRSTDGSGVFGRWTVDRFGLPAYDYTLDQTTDPRAERKEIQGSRDAWSQLGNDATMANAYVDGYVQLWSQARQPQWANRYDPANRHYGGGFGYLHENGHTLSTLWLDRPAPMTRRFGVGYSERRARTRDTAISETVTMPYGDLPVVVHEIELRNLTKGRRNATWWEYWAVNPYDQFLRQPRGLAQPSFDERTKTLSVKHSGDVVDDKPMSIFLTAMDTPVEGFETDAATFFGDGTRARPSAVASDSATGSIAPAVLTATTGRTAFALRSPVTLKPRATVKLRYVYGLDHERNIARDVEQVRARPSTQAETAERWKAWLPRADLGVNRKWMARELQWQAYQLRGASQWEEVCGHHVITQGGLYQYASGMQIGFRDPLQYTLPMVYTEPELAREVLRYSMQEQTAVTGGPIPFGVGPQCVRDDHLGFSSDFDAWLLIAAVEYVTGTRDFDFLDEQVGYRGGVRNVTLGSGAVWEHLKLAYRHMETLAGAPNGNYTSLTGDWSDLALVLIPMNESVMVTAQLAYVYPKLAGLADRVGDHAFADEVRTRAAKVLEQLRGEWTGKGWYARGYFATQQIGKGVIFNEPQPWAMLAGAPDQSRARTLVDNIHRFLTGHGAPGGPAKVGSGIAPPANDPEVTEWAPGRGPNDAGDAVEGGAWYSLNGPLVWALARRATQLPDAGIKAFDEWRRNSLTAHATAYPEAWNGVLNVDDVCETFASAKPDQCGLIFGLLLTSGYAGQNTHPPSWFVFGALKQAGVEPTPEGYRITPSFPLRRWSVRTPVVGVARKGALITGYVRPERDGPVTFEIAPPASGRLRAWIDGRRVKPVAAGDGTVRLTATGRRGVPLDWALSPR